MSKFKVGDRVEVACANSFNEYLNGKVGTVKGTHEAIENAIAVEFDDEINYGHSCQGLTLFGKGRFIAVSELKHIKKEKIVIYREGSKVIARRTDTGETKEAKCNPSDEFDFNVGAKLAFNRLLGIKEVKEEPKQLLNCKFVVIDADDKTLNVKTGKVYEVKDGYFMGDRGHLLPLTAKLYSFDDLAKYFENDFSDLPVKIMKIIEE